MARARPQPSLGLANNIGRPPVAGPSKVSTNGNKTGNDISNGDDDDGVSDGDPPDLSARTEGVDLSEPPEESVLTEDERSLSEAEGDDGSRSSPGVNGGKAGVEPEVDRVSIPASRVSNGSKGSKSSTPRIVLRVPKKG